MTLAHELIGTGPNLVLIPGTFADRRTWSRVIGRLSPRFRCLLFDPRGTGESPDPGTPFGIEQLAGDVLLTMDAAGVDRAHLVGHSLGASVAVLLAARDPARVSRLVACSPAAIADAHLDAVFDLWDGLAASSVPRHVLHIALVIDAFGRGAFENGTVRAIVNEMDRNAMERATIRHYIECDRGIDLSPMMRSVDAKALVIAGAQDSLTGVEQARALANGIGDARLEVIHGAGHSPHLETPMTFARLVSAFLTS